VSRTARALVSIAALVLPLSALAASPAAAKNLDGNLRASSSGTDRMCVGVDDPDGRNTTWVCSPEAQWYAAVIAMAQSMSPA
jgi:hypothetical protein